MGFKLGKKPYIRNIREGINLNILRKPLKDGVMGEAVDGNTIIVNDKIPTNSKMYKRVVNHEAKHAEEMKSGKIAYGDDWVRENNKTYPRRNGEIKYNGKWYPEGDKNLPWEKRAIKAEKNGI
jgi:hypothetical protein|tara:strand:+ start:58 stop:426 length:369 start_codon:yes stop_codon:yes gene_type:complete